MTRFLRKASTCRRAAPPSPKLLPNRATSSSNNSSSFVRAASARCRLRQAMMRVKPAAQGYSMPSCSSAAAPERGKSGLASPGLFCKKPWRRRRQIPKPTPLSARRVSACVADEGQPYVLVSTGHDDNGSRWTSGHGKGMQIRVVVRSNE
jgi:hypothetical protein